MYKRIIPELQNMILYKYDNYISFKYNNDIICDYNNMIIAQYGKKILWYLRKWVLHNLSIGSTLPNTKNFFSAIRWVYNTINGAKEELPTMRPLGIGKHPHTHSKQPVLELSLCFVCVWWNFADFKGQSTAIRLFRDFIAGAKIQHFLEKMHETKKNWRKKQWTAHYVNPTVGKRL